MLNCSPAVLHSRLARWGRCYWCYWCNLRTAAFIHLSLHTPLMNSGVVQWINVWLSNEGKNLSLVRGMGADAKTENKLLFSKCSRRLLFPLAVWEVFTLFIPLSMVMHKLAPLKQYALLCTDNCSVHMLHINMYGYYLSF